MTIKELVSELELIPHNKVKIAIADIDGVLRGKILHKTKFIEVLTGSLGFCDVIFGWDLADACYTNTHFTGWHTGYPDTEIVLDPQTSRKIPWEDGMPFFGNWQHLPMAFVRAVCSEISPNKRRSRVTSRPLRRNTSGSTSGRPHHRSKAGRAKICKP